ncbi:GNAT family N-acetyltransferase [Pontibacter sp. BT310]|uniref:GNAT family N-acetyltransferase n=1 Tax=Pontibacter populi TaxID=890055 RepID=A0ABS6X6N4_9BACT|nr:MULTISPECIES: GNAT family N-acetyltransferase [Pontibacter]MBJ6116688.1 GNAT family N-acetyltransferase [Pontibacter sp. BT310]MBR0569112.1 GNAT family N-acetyltransferase [Microvirga sp. STS03]MBW3363542.1 GNAT family N-acetyltransferase [Pontibacter populi]
MIQVIRAEQEQDLKKAFRIREQVFVEEQQVPREAEYDGFEATASHYLATFEGVPCGAARWRTTDHGVKLERFAVLPDYRNKLVGAEVLKAVLRDVNAEQNGRKVYLHAQLPAVNFYKRNGFKTEGDMFTECDIQHYKMIFAG